MSFCHRTICAKCKKFLRDCEINSVEQKYGIVFQGKQIIPPEYDEILPLSEYTFRVKENNKYGLLGAGVAKSKDLVGRGMRVLAIEKAKESEYCIFFFLSEPRIYDRIELNPNNSITIYKGKSKGLVNKYGDKLIACKYDEITWKEDVYYVRKGNKQGVINKYGNTIAAPIYSAIEKKGTVYWVNDGDKQGIINQYGKMVVPCYYSVILPEGEIYRISENSKYGIINKYGKEIVPCRYDRLTKIKTNYLVKKGNLYGLYNRYGKMLLSCTFDSIDFLRDGKFLAEKSGKKQLYSAYGKLIADYSEESVYYSTGEETEKAGCK